MKTGAYKPMNATPGSKGSGSKPEAADLSWGADNCAALKYQYTVFGSGTNFYAVAKAFDKMFDRNATTHYDSWAINELGQIYQLCDELKAETVLCTTKFPEKFDEVGKHPGVLAGPAFK